MPGYRFITWGEAGGVVRISLNRPPLNIIDIATAGELARAVEAVKARESELVALVVTAEGEKAFSAGVDVGDHTADKAKEMIDTVHSIFRALESLELPTVAALKGLALGGGCELALCCDVAVAADNLRIGLPEIKVGVFPPLAAAVLGRIVPAKRAFEMVLGGETLGADEAQTLGLVNRVVPLADFGEELDAFLSPFKARSRSGLLAAKKAVRAARGLRLGAAPSLRLLQEMSSPARPQAQ